MRVLHLIPSLTGGGAERQLGYLAGELSHRGHEVLIAYSNEGLAPWQAEQLPKRQMVTRRGWDPRFLRELVALIRSWRPDLVHSWILQSDIVGGVAAVLTRTPWILREPTTGVLYQRWIKAWLRAAVARGAADAVVANSEGGIAYWAREAARLPRHFIGNAVPIEEIDRVQAMDLGPAPALVFVGRLETMKNVDVFLAAAAQIRHEREVNVFVCGGGPDRERLERQASDLGMAECVRFTGHTRDVWPIMKGADLFVSLSDFEGCPNAVLEAFAACTPTVLSDIPAHRAIADDHSAYFAAVRDVDSTAAAIRRALMNPDDAAARARNARCSVDHSSIAAMADAYERIYSDVLRRRER